jgi:hypothetical protein
MKKGVRGFSSPCPAATRTTIRTIRMKNEVFRGWVIQRLTLSRERLAMASSDGTGD